MNTWTPTYQPNMLSTLRDLTKQSFTNNKFHQKLLDREINLIQLKNFFGLLVILINLWLFQNTYDTRFGEKNLREFLLPYH